MHQRSQRSSERKFFKYNGRSRDIGTWRKYIRVLKFNSYLFLLFCLVVFFFFFLISQYSIGEQYGDQTDEDNCEKIANTMINNATRDLVGDFLKNTTGDANFCEKAEQVRYKILCIQLYDLIVFCFFIFARNSKF